jgi:hypothetical protein
MLGTFGMTLGGLGLDKADGGDGAFEEGIEVLLTGGENGFGITLFGTEVTTGAFNAKY